MGCVAAAALAAEEAPPVATSEAVAGRHWTREKPTFRLAVHSPARERRAGRPQSPTPSLWKQSKLPKQLAPSSTRAKKRPASPLHFSGTGTIYVAPPRRREAAESRPGVLPAGCRAEAGRTDTRQKKAPRRAQRRHPLPSGCMAKAAARRARGLPGGRARRVLPARSEAPSGASPLATGKLRVQGRCAPGTNTEAR